MRWFTWIASALKKPLKSFFLPIQISAFVMNNKENIKTLIVKKPLRLDCGQTISDYPLAYETYGSLNENKDNAILVCHAWQTKIALSLFSLSEPYVSYAKG